MVNNKKMESRIEGCESRLKVAEQHIAQLGEEVHMMKNDFVTLKSLLTEFMAEFKGKNKGKDSGGKGESSFNKGGDDSGRTKDNHDEIEEHQNAEIEDEENVKDVAEIESEMSFINGASVKEITASTWEQFFEKRVETKARDVSRFLIFALSKAETISGNSQNQWILIRVYKAHYGRSVIFNWKGKSVGLYGKQKAQIFIHLLQSPSKEARMWRSTPNRTILISSNTTARIVQFIWVEDAQNSADCFSINEPYRVPCLVLAALGFENGKRANWKVLLEGYSNFTQLWYLLIHVIKLLCFLWYFHEVLHLLDTEFEKGHSSIEKECILMVLFFAFLEVYAIKLEFSCASSITHCEELMWLQVLNILLSQYDPKEGISESIEIFPVVSHHSSVENFCVVEDENFVATRTMNWIIAVGSFAKEWSQIGIRFSGVTVPCYLGHFTTVRGFVAGFFKSSDVLRFRCAIVRFPLTRDGLKQKVSIANKVLGILNLFADIKGKSNNSFVWTVQGDMEFVLAAMEIKKGNVWLFGFVCVEWMQMDLILYGWRVSYLCFINDMWAPSIISLNRFDPPKQVDAEFLLFLYSVQVHGFAMEKLICAAACSLFCWLVMCHFLLPIIEEMLTIVQAMKLVITAMTDWLETWMKLTLTYTYHLEDKVAIHGGGNDEIGPSYTYYRKRKNDVMVK